MSRVTAPIAEAMRHRHSFPAVGSTAPTTRELLPLIEAAGSVADHGSLKPWRIIALRGVARDRVGAAMAVAAGLEGPPAERMAAKMRRAPLVLAIVVSPKPSIKVTEWEQEAVASGVGHALSLVLHEAGWGVMWRTGLQTRSPEVHRAHELAPTERLLGWLHVGARPASTPPSKRGRRRPFGAKDYLSTL